MDFNTLMLLYVYHMEMANHYLNAFWECGDEDYTAMKQHKIIANAIAKQIENRI